MKQLFNQIWYGRPVVVLGLFGTVGTAVVAFTDIPTWAAATIVGVQAAAGFLQQNLTTPERVDKLHAADGDELGPG